MRTIVVIAHNLRSAHNVGSLLRTAEGLGISKVYMTGYTPYPVSEGDPRLPHLAQRINKSIRKTALGAETSQANEHFGNISKLMASLKNDGYQICALEQASRSTSLGDFKAGDKIALILGNEVSGIEPSVLGTAEQVLEIPMRGKKESFNVIQAAAMALYHLAYIA